MKIHVLNTGYFRLDGGAMFGVVPKSIWNKLNPSDDNNLCKWAMRCLLIEDGERKILVDTGIGDKQDPKFFGHYHLEEIQPLDQLLAALNLKPEEITDVFLTHLHFDHAGGNTTLDPELEDDPRRHVRPSFPNATYVVQRAELEFARHTNERTRASYLPHNFEPIAAAGRWRLLEGDGEVLPGISVRLAPGHVPFHQIVLVRDRNETAAFVADLIPTTAHLPLPWIMGYDLEPLRTLESKRTLLADAMRDGWRIVFEHDPATAVGTPVMEGKSVALIDTIPAPAPGEAQGPRSVDYNALTR